MKAPMDHQPPRRALGDVRGQERGEKLSEFFDFAAFPDKRDRKVTRQELLAILTRKWAVEREMRWHRRLWRYLRNPKGSGPVKVGSDAAEEKRA